MTTEADLLTLGRLRLKAPHPFKGTKEEDFDKWYNRIRTYVESSNRHYITLLDNAEQSNDNITDAILAQADQDTPLVGATDRLQMSRELYGFLQSYTEEGAATYVDGLTERNGFESWRLLVRRYKVPARAKKQKRITEVMKVQLSEANFERDYLAWIESVRKYEADYGDLDDDLKLNILTANSYGILQQQLLFNPPDDFARAMVMVENYYPVSYTHLTLPTKA